MLTVKSAAQVAGSRLIKHFRWCRTGTGFCLRHIEARRIQQERAALANRASRRAWLERAWSEHLWRRTLRFGGARV